METETEKNIIKMSLSQHTARGFINIMGAVVDEFRLSISKEGWKVRAVDKANIVLVNIDLPKDSFLNYEFEESGNWTSSIDGHPTGVMKESLEVGIDVYRIKDFLGGLYKDETVLDEELNKPVEFSFDRRVEEYWRKYILTLTQGMFTRRILLMNPVEIRSSPKGIRFPSDYMLLLDTFELTRIIMKAQKVNDYIRLGFRYKEGNNNMLFIANTVDGDDLPWKAEMPVDIWQSICDKPRDSSSSIFSLDYWNNIIENVPHGKVWLYLGQDTPCKLSFYLGMTGKCEYMLAPIIE